MSRAESIEQSGASRAETCDLRRVADDEKDRFAVISTLQGEELLQRLAIERVCAQSVKCVCAKGYESARPYESGGLLTRLFRVFQYHFQLSLAVSLCVRLDV